MKLSVIVPVLNGKNYIDRALASLCKQSLGDMEVIVVNDGSSDGTKEIVEEFFQSAQLENARLINLEKNQGPSQARKAGVLSATGEYIGFLDADDFVGESFYQNLVQQAKESDADIVCSMVRKVQDNQKEESLQNKESYSISRDEAILNLFNRTSVYQYAVNKIYKAKILKAMAEADAFEYGKFIGEDFDMVYKALKRAEKIVVSPNDIYFYRVHKDSITQQGFTDERKLAFVKYQTFLKDFSGTIEEEAALKRYMMLEYMSFLLAMYRSKTRDTDVESRILDFIHANRDDYIANTNDGFKAKSFARIITPSLSNFFYKIWPKNK